MDLSVSSDPAHLMEIRRARPEDREAVLSIAQGLYDGLDYLPTKYDGYIRDPNRAAIIAWVGNTAVAFHMFYFVDNGKTAVVQASRVREGYQKTGLWKAFRKHQLLLLEQFPCVTRVAFTTGNISLHNQRFKDKKSGSRFITTGNVFQIYLGDSWPKVQSELLNPSFPDLLECVKPLSKEDLIKTLSDKANHEAWFPSGRLILCWEPFRLMGNNLEMIKEKPGLMAYASEAPHENTHQSLSISTTLKVSIGQRYDIDYYGSSIDDAVAHAYIHITDWLQSHDLDDFVPSVYLPDTLDVKEFQQRFSSLFGGSYSQTFSLALFESEIDQYEISDRLELIKEGKIKDHKNKY